MHTVASGNIGSVGSDCSSHSTVPPIHDVCVAPSFLSSVVADHGTGIQLLKVACGSFSQDDSSRFTYAESQVYGDSFCRLSKTYVAQCIVLEKR